MKRRTLLSGTAIGAFFSAIAVAARLPFTPKTFRTCRVLQKSAPTDDIFILDRDPDELMAEAARGLQEKINLLLKGGATNIRINWLNIRNENNPDATVGFFYLLGLKCENPEVNVQGSCEGLKDRPW